MCGCSRDLIRGWHVRYIGALERPHGSAQARTQHTKHTHNTDGHMAPSKKGQKYKHKERKTRTQVQTTNPAVGYRYAGRLSASFMAAAPALFKVLRRDPPWNCNPFNWSTITHVHTCQWEARRTTT